MRYLSIALLLLYPSLAAADVRFAVRPLDPFAADTLERACRSSALVRTMVGELGSSNVVVHIVSSRLLPQGIGGTTRFVADRGGHRYVRITLSTWLPPGHRLAILAHELQHAREMAHSGARDVEALRHFFEETGYRPTENVFETKMALKVEKTVRTELRARTGLTTGSAAPGKKCRARQGSR